MLVRRSGFAATLILAAILGAACSGGAAAPEPTAGTGAGPDAAAAFAEIDEVAARNEQNPGLQVYVRSDTEEFSKAYGTAVLQPARTMAVADTLMVASVTKPMVATAIMRLAAQGRLSLDDPADKWLGDAIAVGTGITVEHLLAMQSGLLDYSEAETWKGPGTTSSLDLVRLIKDRPLSFPPGSTGLYSNTNYAAAGAVVEAVTGLPLQAALADLVFEPAGMTTTTLGGITTARGYLGETDNTPAPGEFPSAAAGVVSTAADLGRFLAALTDTTLVSAEHFALMREPRFMYEDGEYGLGLVNYVVACGTAIGHFGRNESFAAGAFVLPETGRIVAITGNSGQNDDLQELMDLALCA